MIGMSGRNWDEAADKHPPECEFVLHFNQEAMRRLAEQVLAHPSAAAWIDGAQRAAAAAVYARSPKPNLDCEVMDLLCRDAETAFAAHWTRPVQTAPVTPDALRAAAGRRYALPHWPEHVVSFLPVEVTDSRHSTSTVRLPLNHQVVWTWMALPDGSTVDEVEVALHAKALDASQLLARD